MNMTPEQVIAERAREKALATCAHQADNVGYIFAFGKTESPNLVYGSPLDFEIAEQLVKVILQAGTFSLDDLSVAYVPEKTTE